MIASTDIGIWAEHGGLIGLVLFSLFVLIGVFIKTISKKDKAHGEFIKSLIDDERAERKETRTEHSQSFDRLSGALDSLTDQLRNKDGK